MSEDTSTFAPKLDKFEAISGPYVAAGRESRKLYAAEDKAYEAIKKAAFELYRLADHGHDISGGWDAVKWEWIGKELASICHYFGYVLVKQLK